MSSALKTIIGALSNRDLHFPLTSAGIKRVIGRMEKIVSQQQAAATLVEKHLIVGRGGDIRGATVMFQAVAASGESMVIDIKKNGATVLSSTFTYDATKSPKTAYRLSFLADKRIDDGDVLTIERTYVAGSSATPIATSRVEFEAS